MFVHVEISENGGHFRIPENASEFSENTVLGQNRARFGHIWYYFMKRHTKTGILYCSKFQYFYFLLYYSKI